MKTSKGFTLVELLIVIIVIGILSAMMMLSSIEAVSSARAADVISDLLNMKTAALSWYADNLAYAEGKAEDKDGNKFAKLSNEESKIIKYLGEASLKAGYSFSDGKDEETWFAWCYVADHRVFKKLQSRAVTVGLVARGKDSTTATDLVNSKSEYGYVGLLIR